MIVLKLVIYFLLWTLYSYLIHLIAHKRFKYNFLMYFHIKHHAYNYDDSFWPPWHDYFFWFGDFRSSMDVYLTFTLPLIILTIVDPLPGAILLGFHYIYEVFLSRTVLDHNPKISGKITKFIPIGQFHLKHHRYVRCNYSFYITLWDYLFKTDENSMVKNKQKTKPNLKKVA